MAAQRPILIVEDDAALRAILIKQLADDGDFHGMATGSIQDAEAMFAAPDARFDAILLDSELPDGNGRDLCIRLRQQGHRMPIIMMIGDDSEVDIVAALNAGAHDCIIKPFKSAVLLARLRAHIRTFENSEDATFTIGPFTFRPAAKLLQELGTSCRIRLTDKEVSILKYLYRMGSRPVARETMLNEIWGYNTGVTTHTLETHIYRLRQKMEANPASATLLITEKSGYRLDPDGASAPRARAPAFA